MRRLTRPTAKDEAAADELLRSGWVENTINGPLSEDYPDNLEELEDAFIEALGSGELNIASFRAPELAEALKRRKLVPRPRWSLHDLGLKLVQRFYQGDFVRRCDEESRTEGLELYEKLKEELPIEKAVKLGGLCEEVFSIIRLAKEIAETAADGKNHEEILNEVVYWDDPLNILAFINYVEETTGAELKSGHELKKAAQLKSVSSADADKLLTLAKETKMLLAINRHFREEGSWQDALELNPAAFGLPKQWEGDYGRIDQPGLLRQALRSCFALGECNPFASQLPLRDIADALNAPFTEVLAASALHEDQ